MSSLLQTCAARHRPARLARPLLIVSLGMASALAHGAGVSYRATDLADGVPGQDLWQLDYTVTGPLETFASVNLLFDADRYAAIQVTGQSRPDALDTLLTPVDAANGFDGQLNVVARDMLPETFAAQVSVRLVWLGTGTPGAQRYEWLGPDFDVKATGLTPLTSAVPEPDSLALALAGAGLVWGASVARRVRRQGAAAQV